MLIVDRGRESTPQDGSPKIHDELPEGRSYHFHALNH